MKYWDTYLKRLNRFGLDYQSRMQGRREAEFERLLLKSVYRIDFFYDGTLYPATLEKYKQDETQTLQYLLTRLDCELAGGTILFLPDKNGENQPWMVYWLENMVASGYNRYVVLRMTHFITWVDREGNQQSTWAYMYGQEDNMLKDEIRSRSRMDTVYSENLKLNFFIAPFNKHIRRDDYFEVVLDEDFIEAYRVTGYDVQSDPGVEYVSVDPIYLYDHTPAPERPEGDTSEDYYWLERGEE